MLTLSESLRGIVVLGAVTAEGVTVRAHDDQVWAEIDRVAEQCRARFGGRTPSEIPELQPARELYRRTGVDPTKLRPSSEALLRRILRGESLYRINSLVDTCNLCSLEFLLPIGLYDAARIRGKIVIRLGRAGERYESLGKGTYAVDGRLALFDEEGPFGSPTNDSRRTAITEATSRCLMVIFAPGTYAPDRLAAHTGQVAARLGQFAGASSVATAVIGAP